MEDALVRFSVKRNSKYCTVLILVLMEDALVLEDAKVKYEQTKS